MKKETADIGYRPEPGVPDIELLRIGFRVGNQLYDKGRYTYNNSGLYTLYIFPLHAGHTGAYAQYAGAEFTYTVVIRHTRHKLAVQRQHQLVNIVVCSVGTTKRYVFVVA